MVAAATSARRTERPFVNKFFLLAAFAGFILPGIAWAVDAGDLVLPIDFPYGARRELVLETMSRKFQLGSDASGKSSDVDAGAISLRFNTAAIRNARVDFDVGALRSGSGDYTALVGIGLRYPFFDHGPWRVGAFGHARYAPPLSDEIDLTNAPDARVKHDWMEIAGGALASYRLRIADRTAVVAHAGPMLSFIRLDGEISGRDDNNGFGAESKQPLGIAAGLALEFDGANGVRLEVQAFDGLSASIAAAYVF